MNNKGFIATSLMYSFFTVFAILAMTILATYTHYRLLTTNMSNYIQDELDEKIKSKYVTITNFVINGDFIENSKYERKTYSTCAEKNGSNKCCNWYNTSYPGERIYTGTTGTGHYAVEDTSGDCALAISHDKQRREIPLNINAGNYYSGGKHRAVDFGGEKERKIYVRFKLYRRGLVVAKSPKINRSNVCLYFTGKYNTTATPFESSLCFNGSMSGDYYPKFLTGSLRDTVANPYATDEFIDEFEGDITKANYNLYSSIISLKENINGYNPFSNISKMGLEMHVDYETYPTDKKEYGTNYILELIVSDVTEVYPNTTVSDDEVKQYLDKYVNYFGSSCIERKNGASYTCDAVEMGTYTIEKYHA